MTGSASLTVTPDLTAIAVGSGEVPVLATPWLVALCEQATVSAVASILSPGETTVGIHVDIEHLAASPTGATVTATARAVDIGDRRVRFVVEAHDDGRLVGRGTITRARVDRGRFMKGLRSP